MTILVEAAQAVAGGDLEWRPVYKANKLVLFYRGKGVGDFYEVVNDTGRRTGIFRCRLWQRYRVTGGDEVFVLSEADAKACLLEMLERRREEEGMS